MTLTADDRRSSPSTAAAAATPAQRGQVALLTAHIEDLTEHLRRHSKDAIRGAALMLVGKRRRLLKYLQGPTSTATAR